MLFHSDSCVFNQTTQSIKEWWEAALRTRQWAPGGTEMRRDGVVDAVHHLVLQLLKGGFQVALMQLCRGPPPCASICRHRSCPRCADCPPLRTCAAHWSAVQWGLSLRLCPESVADCSGCASSIGRCCGGGCCCYCLACGRQAPQLGVTVLRVPAVAGNPAHLCQNTISVNPDACAQSTSAAPEL